MSLLSQIYQICFCLMAIVAFENFLLLGFIILLFCHFCHWRQFKCHHSRELRCHHCDCLSYYFIFLKSLKSWSNLCNCFLVLSPHGRIKIPHIQETYLYCGIRYLQPDTGAYHITLQNKYLLSECTSGWSPNETILTTSLRRKQIPSRAW